MILKYLTKIEVGKDEAFSLGLSDSYSWHQILWKAFPGHHGEKRFFLFRVDEKETFFLLYLLSQFEVSLLDWGAFQTKKIGDEFLTHSHYRFQLKANPTKRLARGNGKGKRVGIYKEEDLKQWFLRKAEQSGFYSDDFVASQPISDYFNKKGRRNKLNRVDFQGVLKVTDNEMFKTTFNTGIGSAKSLGYGMIVLQPIIV
jgi:CRISPR system Cascade subunit CasE